MKLCCGFCGNDFPEGAMSFNCDGEWLCETCAVDASSKRNLAAAVRLAADAVVKAADAWKVKRDARAFGGTFQAEDYARACEILDDAVLAHRKAKAEQQEASRG